MSNKTAMRQWAEKHPPLVAFVALGCAGTAPLIHELLCASALRQKKGRPDTVRQCQWLAYYQRGELVAAEMVPLFREAAEATGSRDPIQVVTALVDDSLSDVTPEMIAAGIERVPPVLAYYWLVQVPSLIYYRAMPQFLYCMAVSGHFPSLLSLLELDPELIADRRIGRRVGQATRDATTRELVTSALNRQHSVPTRAEVALRMAGLIAHIARTLKKRVTARQQDQLVAALPAHARMNTRQALPVGTALTKAIQRERSGWDSSSLSGQTTRQYMSTLLKPYLIPSCP